MRLEEIVCAEEVSGSSTAHGLNGSDLALADSLDDLPQPKLGLDCV